MRVLFLMRSTVYVRNFEATLRRLASRGHRVHIAADAYHREDHGDLIGQLCREYPSITHGDAPRPVSTPWSELGYDARRGLDYLRYFGKEYADAPKLRYRAELKAPEALTTPRGRTLTASAAGRRVLGAGLRVVDRAVPVDPQIREFVAAQRPDLLIVTPLVEPGSPQSEYVRAAQASGVRTALCVYSWDNLTNKGLIHDDLDLVTVWNDAMREEATTLHRVPSARVVVTGSPAYDHWFTWTPSSTRAAFCADVGLDPARPYVLYLCSSRFIAPDELPFVRRWIVETRAASPALQQTGVLIRPHPQNNAAWEAADFGDLPNVAIWPRGGGNPVDVASRAAYYDSIHHSAAVVGVNTSAQIESAIVGRPVLTVLAPEFVETQEGTLHFHHLRDVNGGLLQVARTMPEHAAQLEAAICRPEVAAERCGRFVEAFVRPFGRDAAAAPRLVAALEATAARGATAGRRAPWWARAVRPIVSRTVRLSTARKRARFLRTHTTRPAEVAQPPAPETAKARTARVAAEAYRRCLALRDAMQAMRAGQPDVDLTAEERDRLAALDGWWDAAPGTVADLRSVSKRMTGVRRSNYEGARGEAVRARLERDLDRLLVAGDAALFVDEPPVLGGFGVTSGSRFYNEDTLRYYGVLSLFDEAGVLGYCRSGARRTVWEVGGGWGGFAYQFRTVCPNVTYVITGAPVMLLVSSTYLSALFPDASIRVYDPARPDAFWSNWQAVDFAFAPESAIGQMRPPAIDVLIDVNQLQHMTPDRAAQHAHRAYDLGARYLFSSADSAAAADDELTRAFEQGFWPHGICAPEYLDRRFAVRDARYWLGWRRLDA